MYIDTLRDGTLGLPLPWRSEPTNTYIHTYTHEKINTHLVVSLLDTLPPPSVCFLSFTASLRPFPSPSAAAAERHCPLEEKKGRGNGFARGRGARGVHAHLRYRKRR